MYPEDVIGIGSYVGEIRQAPNGELYQWEEGVDGFGNPVGFWKAIRKGVSRLARKYLPQAAAMIPGVGPAAAAGIRAAQSAGILGQYETDIMGFGSYVGEIRQGPDGDLYQWEEGVDGLGNAVGFWKAIKKVGRAIRKVARLPVVRKLLPAAAAFIPGVGPAAAAGIRAAQGAGILGYYGRPPRGGRGY